APVPLAPSTCALSPWREKRRRRLPRQPRLKSYSQHQGGDLEVSWPRGERAARIPNPGVHHGFDEDLDAVCGRVLQGRGHVGFGSVGAGCRSRPASTLSVPRAASRADSVSSGWPPMAVETAPEMIEVSRTLDQL